MENIHKSLELLVYTHNLTLSKFLAYLFFFFFPKESFSMQQNYSWYTVPSIKSPDNEFDLFFKT